jgi:hypothetical protein
LFSASPSTNLGIGRIIGLLCVLMAEAINFIRFDEWLVGNKRAETGISHFARLQGVA